MTGPRRIPEFFYEWRQGWSDPDALRPENYLDEDNALKVVLMSQWLFCPDFVEVRGGFFRLHDATLRNVDHWLQSPGMTLTDIELLLNTVHLWSIFQNCDISGLDEALDTLAEAVASSWRGVLRDRFPDRRFTVLADDTATGHYGPGVTFFCERDTSDDVD